MSAPFMRNYNATAARMAGGVQGAAGGRVAAQAPAPIFRPPAVNYAMPNTQRSNAGTYGTGQFRGSEGKHRYDQDRIMAHQYDSLLGQENYRTGREVSSNDALDAALADPRKQAQMFQSFYADSTNAMAAPILRQFQSALSNNAGLNMARFGGQGGSTEQGKGEFNTSDVFSRNLGELIAGQGEKAVDAGMGYTGMLADRANSATGASDQAINNVFQTSDKAKKKGGGLGGFLGGALGAGAGMFLGNPGFGQSVGKKIFGS